MTDLGGDKKFEFMGLVESRLKEGWQEDLHGHISRYEVIGDPGTIPFDEVRLTRADEGLEFDADSGPNDRVAYVIGFSFRGVEFITAQLSNGYFDIYGEEDELMEGPTAEDFASHVLDHVSGLFKSGSLRLKPKPQDPTLS